MNQKIEQINTLLHELSTIRSKLTRIENILRTELGEAVCGLKTDVNVFPYDVIFKFAQKHQNDSFTANEIYRNHQSIFKRHNFKVSDIGHFMLKLCELNYLEQIPTKMSDVLGA